MTLVGRKIGRYRILEQLGSGGMSVVYKGLDTTLDREVAVKVLHPHLAGKDESRLRLAREARAVAKLHHPNILEVFDFSAADAQEEAYLVTEYIRGTTLRQFLNEDEGAFDPPELAAMVIHELSAALAHAHEAGIIHRDIKPENVMVRDDGVLKLMDFGIAKMLDRDERMTLTGALVGSPAHMAPEIIEGLEAGAQADVFSLGTMLYLLVTTRLPFTANNATATLKRILDGVYDDPRQLMPNVSDDLAEIIAICLSRDPSHRYPDAGKLREALAAYLGRLGITRVGEELIAFFHEPKSYRRALVPRLVEALLAQAERYLTERRPAKALASLNQVLGLDTGNARAQALLEQMNQARRQHQKVSRRKRAGVATLGLVALVAVGALVSRALPAKKVDAPLPSPARAPLSATQPRPEQPAPEPVQAAAEPARPQSPAKASPDRPVALAEPPRSAASRPEKPRQADGRAVAAAQPVKPASRPDLLPLVIKVRPFGYVRLDDGPRSPEARAQHALDAAPGHHMLTVTCDFCEDVTEGIDVTPGEANEFMIAAQLKPSRVVFDVQPPEAVVHLGQEQRAAGDTPGHPFDVPFPRGFMGGRYPLPFEISAPGFRTLKGTLELTPGRALTLTRALEAQ